MALASGTKLGSFEVVAQIGACSMSEPRAFTTAVLLSEFFEGVENYFLTNFNKA
jgi:hypothetical protein